MQKKHEAELQGGPSDLRSRHPIPEPPQEEIKVPRRNGYEHYSFSGSYQEQSGEVIAVFQWSYRTQSAE